MSKVIIWGTGAASEVLNFYLNSDSTHEIVAFCKDASFIQPDEHFFCKKPIVSFEEVRKLYPPENYKFAVFMAYNNLNRIREEKYITVKQMGYKCISYVSSLTKLHGTIGENVFILEHNTIQPFTSIGNNVILWAENNIGHHSVIKDNCFFAQATVCGNSRIGKNCFMGAFSVVTQNLTIGDYCVIGSGVTITKNVYNNSVFFSKQPQKLPISSFDCPDLL